MQFPPVRFLARRVCGSALIIVLSVFAGAAVARGAAAARESAARVAVPGDQPLLLRASVDEFDRMARALAESQQVPAIATVVVKDGRIVSQHAYGMADAQQRIPVSTKTVFRLASLSKAFAGALAGLLVEDGYLRWDDHVQDLVPAFELKDTKGAGRLTVEELLSHRVGLPRNAEDPMLERDEPYPLLVYKLRDVPMTCDVGDCYGYQNVAFAVMSDITFAATGDFFSHQVERRIFHPLGMDTATYGREALEASAEWARPHVRTYRIWRPVPVRDTYYHVPPAAGVNASIEDMSQWLLAQLGHKPEVLSPELLGTLHNARVATPGEAGTSQWRRERVRHAQYALGWRVYDYAGESLIFHAGAVQGFRGMIGLLPDRDFGVAILWNCESSEPSGLLPTLLDAYLGLPTRNWVDVDLPKTMKTTASSAAPVAKPVKTVRRRRR